MACSVAALNAQGNQTSWEPPVVYQAAGPNNGSVNGTIDEFRNVIGGVNNVNSAGPLAEGRREINWVGRVVTTAGDYAGPDDSPTRDVVMMDDFIYAEPRVR